MERYFFDWACESEILRDFKGSSFKTRADACRHAELLAIHLQYDPEYDYSGWNVIVFDALGEKLRSVPVGDCCDTRFRVYPEARLQPVEAA